MGGESRPSGDTEHSELAALRAENSSLKDALELERARFARLADEKAGHDTLFRTLDHGVVFQDREGRVLLANPAAERILGVRQRDMTGRTSADPRWDTVSHDGSPLRGEEAPAMVALRTGEPVRNVVLGIRDPATEARRWLLVTAVPLFREGETQAHQVYACFSDITAFEAERQALDDAQRRVRNLVGSSPMGIHMYRLEADGRLVFVGANPAADRLLGVSNEQFVGKPIEEAFPPLAATEIPDRYRQAARDGVAWKTEQVAYADGQIAGAFEVHAFQTAPGEMAAKFLEITDRKRAEEALKTSEERFRLLFECGPLGMAIVDRDLCFVEANHALCAMLGRSPEELRRLTIKQVTHPDDIGENIAALQHVLSGENAVFKTEKRYVRGDGTYLWGAVTVTRLEDGQGKFAHFLALIEDITERIRAQEERRAFEARLAQQQKLEAIGTLASGVAHEINNPLNGILKYAELLTGRLSPDGPEHAWAQSIVTESERVSHIVKNLLTFSRHEKHSHSEASMSDIVQGILSLVGSVLRKDQIHLVVDVPVELPAVRCRTQQIQQVLLNLLTNARDALNERYPAFDEDKRVEVRSAVFLKGDKRWLRTTVSDRGSGIPPSISPRVFDPFFTTKPRDQGTGLGLSLSFSIVREHHGDLWFETDTGTGTRFHIDLPIDNGWRLEPVEPEETA